MYKRISAALIVAFAVVAAATNAVAAYPEKPIQLIVP